MRSPRWFPIGMVSCTVLIIYSEWEEIASEQITGVFRSEPDRCVIYCYVCCSLFELSPSPHHPHPFVFRYVFKVDFADFISVPQRCLCDVLVRFSLIASSLLTVVFGDLPDEIELGFEFSWVGCLSYLLFSLLISYDKSLPLNKLFQICLTFLKGLRFLRQSYAIWTILKIILKHSCYNNLSFHNTLNSRIVKFYKSVLCWVNDHDVFTVKVKTLPNYAKILSIKVSWHRCWKLRINKPTDGRRFKRKRETR